jgi:hypothetical protein
VVCAVQIILRIYLNPFGDCCQYPTSTGHEMADKALQLTDKNLKKVTSRLKEFPQMLELEKLLATMRSDYTPIAECGGVAEYLAKIKSLSGVGAT